MPRIVPLEYISTTLGLHKSVRTLPLTDTLVLRHYLQLEHTGMTITQTLSGLWLDFEKKKRDDSRSVTVLSEKGESRLQWLLNGFLFVSVLHLMAIRGLGYLNERKQQTQNEAAAQNEGEDEDEERRGVSGSASGIDEPLLSPDLPSQSPSDQTPAGEHTTSPLLHPMDVSFVYQSYGTHPRPHRPQQDTVLMGAITPAEVGRGKLFASLCAATVVFTWALFLVTSFIKIRSRREREGHL